MAGYDNPGSDADNMEGMHEDPGMAGNRSHMDDGMEILHVERDMLPAETLEKLKAGDILEFKVVNPNENGLVAVAYNMPAKTKMSAQREGVEEMSRDFADYMSARKGEGDEGGMSEGTGSY